MITNSIALREWRTGPKFTSRIRAAEATTFGSWYFCEMKDGKCEMQTATISLMEITSEIMRKVVTKRVTAVSDLIQPSQLLKTAFILCFLHSLQITLSFSLHDSANTLEPSKRILMTWPYQTPQGCWGVSVFGISAQWDLEIGNARFVFKIFFLI